MNHYKHHLGDYAKDTAHLSMVEDGAYSRLLRRCYSTEAPLPAEMGELYRIAGARTAAEKQAVKNVMKDFFTLEPDGYHQKRVDAEIAEYRVKAERNRAVGKTGGRPRNNPDGNPEETQTVSTPKPKPNPQGTLASSHKPEEKQPPKEERYGDGDIPASPPPQRASPPPGEFPTPTDPRVSALHGLCLGSRVNVPILAAQQWVADGVTEEQLRAAIERGNKRKSGASLNASFLQLMVNDVRAAGVGYDRDAVIAETIASVNAKEARATH